MRGAGGLIGTIPIFALSLAVAAALAPVAAGAQDLSLFAGGARGGTDHASTRAFALAYERGIGVPGIARYLFGGVVYLNEGHIPGHHRDGMAAQLGVRTNPGGSGLSLSAAAGPYRYFDTAVAEEQPQGYADAHGWGTLYTLGAAWRAHDSRWLYRLRVDRVRGQGSFDTTSVFAGVGYRLDQDGSFPDNAWPRTKGGADEVFAAGGTTIVNSFHSQKANAGTVEWRHRLGPAIRASVGWLSEGDARLIRRDGVLVQGWLEPTFSEGRYSLGVGFGPYFAVDSYRPDARRTQALLSATASYRLSTSWLARLTWHRSVTSYDRDSDIFLLGVGYRF